MDLKEKKKANVLCVFQLKILAHWTMCRYLCIVSLCLFYYMLLLIFVQCIYIKKINSHNDPFDFVSTVLIVFGIRPPLPVRLTPVFKASVPRLSVSTDFHGDESKLEAIGAIFKPV